MNIEKPKTTIIIGDSRRMEELKDESVHLIITSPPYWQLTEHNDNRANCGQRKKSVKSILNFLTHNICPYYHQDILFVCK